VVVVVNRSKVFVLGDFFLAAVNAVSTFESARQFISSSIVIIVESVVPVNILILFNSIIPSPSYIHLLHKCLFARPPH